MKYLHDSNATATPMAFRKKILTDNDKEFANKKMEAFCEKNGIQVAHGSPRTPTTQGLVERSNRS